MAKNCKSSFEILQGSPVSKGKADSGAIFTDNFILLLSVLARRFSLKPINKTLKGLQLLKIGLSHCIDFFLC